MPESKVPQVIAALEKLGYIDRNFGIPPRYPSYREYLLDHDRLWIHGYNAVKRVWIMLMIQLFNKEAVRYDDLNPDLKELADLAFSTTEIDAAIEALEPLGVLDNVDRKIRGEYTYRQLLLSANECSRGPSNSSTRLSIIHRTLEHIFDDRGGDRSQWVAENDAQLRKVIEILNPPKVSP